MKLHGNAALSWTGRRRLAERVVVEGWTLTAAARAAGVSVRCARKWVGRYRLEGERVHIDVKRLGRIEGGAGKRAFGGERRLRHNPTRTDLEGKRRHYVGYE